jgi:hypothetical protein
VIKRLAQLHVLYESKICETTENVAPSIRVFRVQFLRHHEIRDDVGLSISGTSDDGDAVIRTVFARERNGKRAR